MENKLQIMLDNIDTADTSSRISLTRLMEQCDVQELETAISRILLKIKECREEGNFTCIISNDILEEIFTERDCEAFNEYLITAVVAILRKKGYIVKYEDLMYSDISNIMEINW